MEDSLSCVNAFPPCHPFFVRPEEEGRPADKLERKGKDSPFFCERLPGFPSIFCATGRERGGPETTWRARRRFPLSFVSTFPARLPFFARPANKTYWKGKVPPFFRERPTRLPPIFSWLRGSDGAQTERKRGGMFSLSFVNSFPASLPFFARPGGRGAARRHNGEQGEGFPFLP